MNKCPRCGLDQAETVITCDCGQELVSGESRRRLSRQQSAKCVGVGVAFLAIGLLMLMGMSALEVAAPLPLWTGLVLLGVFSIGIIRLVGGVAGLLIRRSANQSPVHRANRRGLSVALTLTGLFIIALAILYDPSEVGRGRQTAFSDIFYNVVGLGYGTSHSAALYINHVTLSGVVLCAIAAALKARV